MRRAHGVFAVIVALALLISIIAVVLLYCQPAKSFSDANSDKKSNTQPPLLQSSPTPTSTLTPSPNPTPTLYNGVPVYSYNVVQSYPHSTSAFTQGLLVESDGVLLESTGMYGSSSLRRVRLSDGEILQQYDLPSELFWGRYRSCGR